MRLSKIFSVKKLDGKTGELTNATKEQKKLIKDNSEELEHDILRELFEEGEDDEWTTFIVLCKIGKKIRLVLWYCDGGKIREFVITEKEIDPFIKILSEDMRGQIIMEKL